MIRYVRLYLHFLQFSFGKSAAYRFDFWCRILMDISYYAVSIGFFKILFLKTGALCGWSEAQIMVFVGAHLMLDALQMTVISGNLWEMPNTINKGDLDYHIVRPVSTLFILCFREIAVGSVVNLLIAAGFFWWALLQYPEPLTMLQVVSFLFFLVVGFFIYFGLRLLISLPVFWTHSPYGLEKIFYAMLPFMERPDVIFRGILRMIILTIIPFAVVVSFPARMFFSGITWSLSLHMFAVLILMWTLVLFVWGRGIRNYSSASS